MIILLDTGYSGTRLFNSPQDEIGHGTIMANFILDYCGNSDVVIRQIQQTTTITNMKILLDDLIQLVGADDLVVVPWVINRNDEIDNRFSKLARKCTVIGAAGNDGKNIDLFTPARNPDVITVGCLNKSGMPAKLSNRSNTKSITWMFGTNMTQHGIAGKVNCTGTSVSCAIYAGLLYRARKTRCADTFMRRTLAIMGRKFKNELA